MRRYSLSWAFAALALNRLPGTGLSDNLLIIGGVVLVAVAAGVAWMGRSR